MEDKLKEMKQQNDLSDIVLEKERAGGTEKMKKILLYAASLILLFLIALVAMKLFNETPQKESTNLAQIGNGTTSSADESIDQISQKLEDTNKLFQQEPIIDESAETDLKFEEMVRKLKAQDAAEKAPEESTAPETAVASATAPAAAKESKKEFLEKVDQLTKEATSKKEKIGARVTQEASKTAKVIAPKIVKKPIKPVAAPKPAKEVVATSRMTTSAPVQKLSTLSGYFIQVGATANAFPNRRYLQKIKNAGYDYIVHSVVVKGRKIKKILIGPFASRSAAQRKLPDVKAKINQSAYLYRIQ